LASSKCLPMALQPPVDLKELRPRPESGYRQGYTICGQDDEPLNLSAAAGARKVRQACTPLRTQRGSYLMQDRVDEPPIVRCPGCDRPMEAKERTSVMERLVDIRYVCPACGMETKRTIADEAP
jgi:hypothetical protein